MPSMCFLLFGLLLLTSAWTLQESEDEKQTDIPGINTGSDFSGAQVLKVMNGRTPFLEKLIDDENMDVWYSNTTHVDILVPKQKVDSIKSLLSENKIDYTIMIENLQKAIDDQNPQTGDEDEDELDGRKGHRMNWEKYQRLETIYGYLDYLMQTYPGKAQVGVIGQSTEGRPIKYIRISSGNPNAKAVLVDGGIHAREWISPAAVTYIIRQLTENRSSLSTDIQELDFYIIPVLNPDGYEYTHTYSRMWRKNRSSGFGCRGVDLNRNFNFHWGGKGTSGNTCSEIYRGNSAASESETRALMSMVSGLNNLKAYVTFHSYGQYILIPYGYDYNSLPPNFADMKVVADRAALAMRQAGGQYYRVGNTAQLLYPASGGSDDWVKSTGVQYSYTVELRDTGSYGFTLPAREIIPTAIEAFEALKVISAAAARV